MDPVAQRRKRRLDLLAKVDRHVPISFALVGSQKAATSTIYRMLVQHPEVVGGPEKEMRFFCFEHLDWDDPDYTEYVRPATRPDAHVAGDATPDYSIWPHALERMHRYNRDLRLMMTLRDPIERAMSQWSMQRDRAKKYPDVPEVIAEHLSAKLPDEIPEGVPPWEFRRRTIFARGLYSQQLRRGFEIFDPEQWLLMDFRDVTAQPDATMNRVTDFLGLSAFEEHPALKHNNQTRSDHTGTPPSVDDVRRMVDVYADDLADLEKLSGVDVSGWSTSKVIAGELEVEELTEKIGRKLGLLH